MGQAVSNVQAQIQQENATLPPEKELKSLVLNQLIDKKLQLQLAKQLNLTVTDKELDQTIVKIAKENNLSLNALNDKLKNQKLTMEAYRKEMHDQLLIHKLQEQEIASRVSVTPEEINQFIRTQKKQTSKQTPVEKKYHLEEILISLPDSPSQKEKTEATQLASSILASLKQGKSLSDIPSNSLLAFNDLGWMQSNEIPSAFLGVVSHMQANELAGPIQTGNGLHILKLIEIQNLSAQQNPPTKEEASQQIFQKKMNDALKSWLSKLRDQAFIVNSDELSHRSRTNPLLNYNSTPTA